MADKKDKKKDKKAKDEGDDEKKDKKGKKSDAEPSPQSAYLGLGLVVSMIVGFSPLRDAFEGNGSFDGAMMRFMACVAVCVGSAAVIGRLLESAPPEEEPTEEEPETLSDVEESVAAGAPGKPATASGADKPADGSD